MKLALISAVLFTLSYVVVNGGLGPHPLAFVVPLAVVVATTGVAGHVMARRRKRRTPADPSALDAQMLDTPVRPQPIVPPPRTPGSKARKLF